MKIFFTIYAIGVLFGSPWIIISLMKFIQIHNVTNTILLIIYGTTTFLSILFSLGIIINRTKIWYMGFALTIVFSILSLALLVMVNRRV